MFKRIGNKFLISMIIIITAVLLAFFQFSSQRNLNSIKIKDVDAPIPPQLYSSSYKLIGTGNRLGSYFPAGCRIVQQFNSILGKDKTGFKAIETNGANENVDLIEKGLIVAGMSEIRVAEEKYNQIGTGSKIMAAWPLWPDIVHVIKTPAKYEDQNVFPGMIRGFMGQSGSSTLRTSNEILSGLNKLRTNYDIPQKQVVSLIKTGKLGFAVIQAGIPNNTVTELLQNSDCSLYNFKQEELTKIIPNVKSSISYLIPEKYYSNDQKAINTIAIPNILVISSDTPEEYVYAIAEGMTDIITNANVSTLGLPSTLTEAKQILTSLNIPVHPLIIKYIDEKMSPKKEAK